MNQEMLSRYLIALHFFSRVIQESPDEGMLRKIAEEDLFRSFDSWACFAAPEGRDTAFNNLAPAGSIAALVEQYAAVPEKGDYHARYIELHLDHAALFSGPNPKSPPWESVWREREKLLFGEQTRNVSNTYLDWGMCIANAGREPEDHLGLELSFVSFLLQTIHGGDPATVSRKGISASEELRAFLENHLMVWAGDCLAKAATEATTPFYREIPALCWVLIKNLHSNQIARCEVLSGIEI